MIRMPSTCHHSHGCRHSMDYYVAAGIAANTVGPRPRRACLRDSALVPVCITTAKFVLGQAAFTVEDCTLVLPVPHGRQALVKTAEYERKDKLHPTQRTSWSSSDTPVDGAESPDGIVAVSVYLVSHVLAIWNVRLYISQGCKSHANLARGACVSWVKYYRGVPQDTACLRRFDAEP